ncbi:DMT family transporter [Rudanella lutea]|uniref:DMT family transporter n=1 Tax=Rudanella lutea TaxID=451374 RepID=UPI000375615A|nr:DMT family transporter [Rudanella lutea]
MIGSGAIPGLLFAAFWASASVATKFGVQSAHPFWLATIRFMIAGGGMLLFAYGIGRRNPLPNRVEWQRLTIFAFLNTTVYLGLYVLAMREVSAGIGSLGVATNPLFITLMSAVWLRRPLRWYEGAGIALGLLGVTVATYPLLEDAHATVRGLLILMTGMVSVSAATVYYARFDWRLPPIVINGWQVLIGGLLLLPVTLLVADFQPDRFDRTFWASVFWLVLPVSVVALQLWFYLVRQDAVRASLWLFLCPIFGFAYSAVLTGEPITLFTLVGTALVLAGLWLARKKK